MYAMMMGFDANERPPLSICPKCGRQVRLDGHCECESIFEENKKNRRNNKPHAQ